MPRRGPSMATLSPAQTRLAAAFVLRKSAALGPRPRKSSLMGWATRHRRAGLHARYRQPDLGTGQPRPAGGRCSTRSGARSRHDTPDQAAGCPATSSTRSRNDPPHARGAADDRPSPSPPLGHPHPRGPRPRTAPRPGGLAQNHAYTHNGSAMVVGHKAVRRCASFTPPPRSGLRPEGVTEGTELFRRTLEKRLPLGSRADLPLRVRAARLLCLRRIFRLGESFTPDRRRSRSRAAGLRRHRQHLRRPNANLVFTGSPASAPPRRHPRARSRLCVNGIVATSSLNLRTGPGLGYGVIGEIPANACDVIAGPAAASGWQAVRWQGRLGWASSTYLRAGTLSVLRRRMREASLSPCTTPIIRPGAAARLRVVKTSRAMWCQKGHLPMAWWWPGPRPKNAAHGPMRTKEG